MLGGNLEPKHGAPDTQNVTSFYNIKTQKFTKGRNLNYDRWYGSIVRTAENNFIMVGGIKIKHHEVLTQDRVSHIPEILTSNDDGTLSWKILKEAESLELLGAWKMKNGLIQNFSCHLMAIRLEFHIINYGLWTKK